MKNPDVHDIQRTVRFGFVGIAALLIYAVIAEVFMVRGASLLPPALASLAAYAVAAVFSYTGHKYITFRSGGDHASEAPRYLSTTAAGLALSWTLPKLLVEGLGAPPIVPILVICTVLPVANYFILSRWVFSSPTKTRING